MSVVNLGGIKIEVPPEVAERKARYEYLLNAMKSEPCKSPFDEMVIDFLEMLYEDRRHF
jgi:hypothetical protein